VDLHSRRDAFSKAHPFSASIVGQGSSFTYRQGVLSVLSEGIVRVLDVRASSASLTVDLYAVTRHQETGPSSDFHFLLLYYSDGILAVYYGREERPNNGRIFAINTEPGLSEQERLVKVILLESSYKLFVRHTSSYLYWGTYTGAGYHGHHEWEISGVSLESEGLLPECRRPLKFDEFFGTDIGQTITFEIHNGYFYALSNQTSFDVEELDWTSFYHCIRFPLDRPVYAELEANKRIYRRQHSEGPIHDSWTDLTLQVDEGTNELVIVESRREWLKSSSRQSRTFYVSKIGFPYVSSTTSSNDDTPTLLPDNDRFTDLVGPSDRPNYAPEQPRCSWNMHPEAVPYCRNPRNFILARTKFRAYNYSCSSFLDLVEDERCCPDSSSRPCLRIRVGSRRVAPLNWTPRVEAASTNPKDKEVSKAVPDDEVVYRHSAIKIWPPPASTCPCAKRLHDIFNPQPLQELGNSRTIIGVADERSLVYMVKAGRSASDTTLGTVVLVNFDPSAQRPLQPDDMDSSVEDGFVPTHWQWSPGLHARCQRGECR
jgi:hypothetical protein